MSVQPLSPWGSLLTPLVLRYVATNTTVNPSSEKISSNIYHGTTMANSLLYIIAFMALLGLVAYFYIRAPKKSMKFNQKMLFFLVTFFIVIQLTSLTFRTVYNIIGIYVNNELKVDRQTLYRDYHGIFVAYVVFGVLEFCLALSEMMTILIIMCFLINVFLKTVYLVGAISKAAFYGIVVTVNILTAIFAVIFLAIIVSLVIVELLVKLEIITFDQLSLYVACFVIYLVVMCAQACVLIGSGIRVLRVIRQRSSKATQVQENTTIKGVVQRPFTKIVGLIVGIVISCFLQILAGVISVFTSFWADDLHFLDYFFASLCVLSFSILVMLLYNPLLSESYEPQSADSKRKSTTVMNSPVSTVKSIPEELTSSNSSSTLTPSSNIELMPAVQV